MFFRKARRIKELESALSHKESELFDTQKALFEMTQWERIAAEKLTHWVGKHDEILIKFKELKKVYERIFTTGAGTENSGGGSLSPDGVAYAIITFEKQGGASSEAGQGQNVQG